MLDFKITSMVYKNDEPQTNTFSVDFDSREHSPATEDDGNVADAMAFQCALQEAEAVDFRDDITLKNKPQMFQSTDSTYVVNYVTIDEDGEENEWDVIFEVERLESEDDWSEDDEDY